MSVTHLFILVVGYHCSGWRFRPPTTHLHIGSEFLTLTSLHTPSAWQIIPGGSELSPFMLLVNVSVAGNIFLFLAPQVLGPFISGVTSLTQQNMLFMLLVHFYQDGMGRRGDRGKER